MATFNHISGAEPSTVTFKLATVTQTRNSSNMHQEIMALGDPDTSNAIAAVLNAAPKSTAWSLAVRVAGGPSSAVDLQFRPVFPSTATDNPVSAAQAGTWTMNLPAGYLSSAVPAGNSSGVTTRPVWSSTNTDQPVSAAQAGTWSVNLGTHLQSSAAPSSGSSGLVVRQVIDNLLTTASTNAFASTSLSIQSSGASLRSYVTAYTITSTVQAPTKVAFYSSGTMLWPVVLAALSSAVSGVNLAVAPPGYLFRSGASEALSLQVGSSVAGFKAAVSYFRAP